MTNNDEQLERVSGGPSSETQDATETGATPGLACTRHFKTTISHEQAQKLIDTDPIVQAYLEMMR